METSVKIGSTRKIKFFADGANLNQILAQYKNPEIEGFTTNPTLMRKAGVSNYENFAHSLLSEIKDLPISFEVFADDSELIFKQAMKISSWGKNVNVKVPITNTKGESLCPVIKELSNNGVKVNVTAILTIDQVKEVVRVLNPNVFSIISVFAGRIADTGLDPVPVMREAKDLLKDLPTSELLWASTRQVYSIIEAESCGTDIITISPEILNKVGSFGKDLNELSLETVKMFYDDASSANYKINI